MKDDKFYFFIPAEFEKGKSGKEDEPVKIKGVISTPDEDTDGETLIPSGFDLSRFLSSGNINYNHNAKHDPSSIIGHPVKAKIINDKEVYMEGILYPDVPKAKDVITLANTLEKYGNGRKLGFSVEGKALERDPFNNKRITKALITGVAITPCPKNVNTSMSIIKSLDAEFEEECDIQKSESPNGGDQYIVDITNPETGMRYMVKKDFSIKIEKALTTDSGRATIKEDVEKQPKNQIDYSDNNIRKSIVVLAAANKLGKLSQDVLEKIKNRIKIL